MNPASDPTPGPEYIRPYGGLLGGLRASARVLGILVVTLGMLLAWAFVSLWPRGEPASAAVRRRMTRRWAAVCCRVIGLRVRVDGQPPGGAGFLVSNHVSYLDILALMSLTGCTFVAKREIAGWPVIGTLARRAGTLFVNRNGGRDTAQTLQGMARSKANGDLVMFFPEGRTSTGAGVLPFRSGLLSLAADNGVPVEAAAVAYSTPADIDTALGLAWTGEQAFTPHAWRVLTLPSVEARVALATETVIGADRKLLAQDLQARVTALHRAVGAMADSGDSQPVLDRAAD